MVDQIDPNADERFDVAKTVMLVGFIASVTVSVSIVAAWLFVLIKGWNVDSSLKEMALMSLTFLTTLAGFAKTFVEKA